MISPLPIYTPTFEGWDDPKRSTFPLQLFGFHYKSRTHSSYGNIDVLQAACRQEVWINPLDAQKRGIANGDKVRVFNDRGEVRLPAKVTPRILPGVRAHGIMRIWLAIKLTTAPASIRSRRCVLPPWQKGILNIQIWWKSKKSKPPAPGRFYAPGAPRFANTTTFKTLFWMSIVSCYENHQP